MKMKRMSKFLSLLLLVGMLLSLLPAAALAADDAAWTEVTWAEISADDTVAITMSKDGTTWILPNAATGKTPAAVVASFGDDGALQADASAYGWTIRAFGDGRSIGSANGYLNPGSANNGLRANGAETAWNLSWRDMMTAR